jgi:hypothetical protein
MCVLGANHSLLYRLSRKRMGAARGESARDHALWRRGLHHRLALAARIFGATDADHPQSRRYPVEHFAHALADRLDSAAVPRAVLPFNIEQPLFAFQMFGQRLAARRPRIDDKRRRSALDDPGDISIEILQAKHQLARIEPLGSPAKLRALELLYNLLKAANLAIAVFDKTCHIAHQPVQKCRVTRQLVEIEPHGCLYTRQVINH